MQTGKLRPDDEDRLRRSPAVAVLPEKLANRLFEAAELVDFKLGGTLVKSAEPCEFLFILIRGKLRITAVDSSGEEANLYTLSRPGDIAGFDCLDCARFSMFTARASTESIVLRLPVETARNLAKGSDQFRELLSRQRVFSGWYQSLKKSHVFGQLSFWQAREILMRCQSINVSSGESLDSASFREDGQYLLVNGSVQIEESGGQRILELGDGFGRQTGTPLADLRQLHCVVDCELIFVPDDALADLELYNPSIGSEANQLSRQGGDIGLSEIHQSDVASGFIIDDLRKAPEQTWTERLSTRFRRALRKYPYLRQESSADCGTACLAMVCAFYGKQPRLNLIRELAGVARYGTSLLGLAEAAEKLGFAARGISATYEGLLEVYTPVICHLQEEHFVVVYELNRTEAIIGDPAQGILQVDREQFSLRFSGSALELSPVASFANVGQDRGLLGVLLPLVSPYTPLVRDILIASFIYQLLILVPPLLTQMLVDKVIVHKDFELWHMLVLAAALQQVFISCLCVLRSYVLSHLAIRVDQSILRQFYQHVLSLPFKFFEERTTGEILSRFSERKRMRDFLSGAGMLNMLDGTMSIVFVVIIFFYNPFFGACFLAYVALNIANALFFTPILKGLSRKVYENDAASESLIVESIRGIQRVKSAAMENRVRWKWEGVFDQSLKARSRQSIARTGIMEVSRTLNHGGRFALIFLAASLVIKGELTIGQLMALNLFVAFLSERLLRVMETWDDLQASTVAIERIGEILQLAPEEPDQTKKLSVPNIAGRIEVDSVSFRYSQYDLTNTLSNVCFQAKPGEMIALVGRSGSGKSTLFKILLGLVLPTSGRVLIDGVDLAQMSLWQFRKQVGAVFQDEYLFRGTIRDNLSIYNPDASMEEIIEAAKVANIHDFVSSLPLGYETSVLEGASNFSGGQRQRLAIARSVLHRPKIMLFDEATSALDTESERHIGNSLATIRKDRTMLVIAHRLSTVKDADLILVMDRGQIVERGKHEELVKQRGLYYYLHQQGLGA